MARPIYEKDTDKEAEQRVAKIVGETWGVTVHKLPMRYKLDWILEEGDKIVGVAEFKKRDITRTQYAEIMLSLDKVLAGLWLAGSLHTDFHFIVEFKDGLYFTPLADVGTVRWHGRSKDKRDWQDVEPCCMIPNEEFIPITDSSWSRPDGK